MVAVHDGDTLRLADGRDVRLVGINTPELGRDGEPDQPLAVAARRALAALLDGERRVALELAPERSDPHGRLLAHIHAADGRNLTAALLERGLGWPVAFPPNLGHLDCYTRIAAAARAAGRGVHGHAAYRAVAAADLGDSAGGFTRVHGTIGRVGRSARAWWLDLGGLSRRLAGHDLPYFDTDDPRAWRGRRLRVRGWIYRVDGDARMNLRHPAAVDWND